MKSRPTRRSKSALAVCFALATVITFAGTAMIMSCATPESSRVLSDSSEPPTTIEYVRVMHSRASADRMERASPVAFAAFDIVEEDRDRYDIITESGFIGALDQPRSTFSIDVDSASYTNVRRFLQDGIRPPNGAVRIEEMLNYFRFPALPPDSDQPFSVETEMFEAPWAADHFLVRIGLHGREITPASTPPRNLVFLLDVSGSMQGPDRLPLVKRGLAAMVEHLRPEDRVSIVVYAGATGLVLPPTSGTDRNKILDALARLSAGGSTAGAAGIRLAYDTARSNFDPRAINRVILATDGDFNVGVTSRSELAELIETERESGVFLSVLGVGRGNLNDAGLEELADRGNGNYAYIDSLAEARRVLIDQAGATLVTIAKDVKIQVEFNPALVESYRLIGYENRRMADRDFNDDRKDAGEIGAGHHVTALYEVVPVGVAVASGAGGSVDPLRYQTPPTLRGAANTEEWLTVKLRYKDPDETESQLVTERWRGRPYLIEEASDSGRFSAAVALFGMLLRDSEFSGTGSFEMVESLTRRALDWDEYGERDAFLQLVALAENLEP